MCLKNPTLYFAFFFFSMQRPFKTDASLFALKLFLLLLSLLSVNNNLLLFEICIEAKKGMRLLHKDLSIMLSIVEIHLTQGSNGQPRCF